MSNINELSISTTAGSMSGQLMKPCELKSINRIPDQRTILYRIIKIYHNEEETELDRLEKLEEQLGSYWQLIKIHDSKDMQEVKLKLYSND